MTTATTQTVMRLSLAAIVPSPDNPRKHFAPSWLAELGASMLAQGQLAPCLVRPHPKQTGKFELAAGESRYRAAGLVKIDALDCVVRPMDDAQFLEALTFENLKRRDLRPLEEARSYALLQKKLEGWTVERIAEKSGVSIDYVRDRMRLLRLDTPATKLLEESEIELGHALELAKLSPKDQARAIKDGLFITSMTEYRRSELLPLGDTPKRKPVTVYELKAWIEKFVLADLAHPDLAELFPATAKVLERSVREKLDVVYIATGYVRPEAKGRTEVLTPANWRRADGEGKSKICDRKKKVGIVAAADAARSQGFLICTSKACAVHFPEAVKRAAQKAKGETKAVAKGKAPLSFAEQEKRRRDAEAKEKAARAARRTQLATLLPAIKTRILAAVERQKAGSLLADLMPQDLPAELRTLVKQVPAKDLLGELRRVALARHLEDCDDAFNPKSEWWFERHLTDLCKRFGINLTELGADASPTKHLKCTVCSCTEAKACKGGCAWVTTEPPVCSNPKCVKARATVEKMAAAKKPAAATPVAPAKAKKAVVIKPPAGFMKPVQPDAVLAAIVGETPLARVELTKKLWQYIKTNGLQDKKNRRMINADEKLKALFGGKAQVSMFDMTKAVAKHHAPVKKARAGR